MDRTPQKVVRMGAAQQESMGRHHVVCGASIIDRSFVGGVAGGQETSERGGEVKKK